MDIRHAVSTIITPRRDPVKPRRGGFAERSAFALTTPEQEAAWTPILDNWNTDEVDFERGDNVAKLLGCWGGPPQSILRVWWD